jgi:peroxiredoxin Q/BCP
LSELKKGDKAPAFALTDQDENTVKLADFKGSRLLVYFYPKADTPGCTVQSCAVSAARPKLSRKKIKAVGISPDPPRKQKAFDDKHGLGFPLLADEDHKVAEAFGVWGEKSFMGKKFMGIVRSAFLIGATGKVEEAWYGVSPKDTVPNVLEASE